MDLVVGVAAVVGVLVVLQVVGVVDVWGWVKGLFSKDQ